MLRAGARAREKQGKKRKRKEGRKEEEERGPERGRGKRKRKEEEQKRSRKVDGLRQGLAKTDSRVHNEVMDKLEFATFLLSKIPFERIFARDGIKSVERFEQGLKARQVPSTTETPPSQEHPSAPPQTQAVSPSIPQEPPAIATACVACAVGHFSTSSGLLKEAVRFKDEGMSSNEIISRLAGTLEEQNALERVDLSPEKIRQLPAWEKQIAEEALRQSRQLRHRLETIRTTDELEQVAADTKTYYLDLSRDWYRGRFSNLGPEKAEAIAQHVGG